MLGENQGFEFGNPGVHVLEQNGGTPDGRRKKLGDQEDLWTALHANVLERWMRHRAGNRARRGSGISARSYHEVKKYRRNG